MSNNYHFYLAMNGISFPYNFINNFKKTQLEQNQTQDYLTNYKLKYISFKLLNGII